MSFSKLFISLKSFLHRFRFCLQIAAISLDLGTYDVGTSKPVIFDKSCEVPLFCNVHAEMSAFVVVLDNPYFGVTAKDGSFTINNVPPGTYKLKTWHEKLRYEEQDVKVEGGKTVEADFLLKKRK